MAESPYPLAGNRSTDGIDNVLSGDFVVSLPEQTFGGDASEQDFRANVLLREINALLAESGDSMPVLERIVAGLEQEGPSLRASVYRFNSQGELLPIAGAGASDAGVGLGLAAHVARSGLAEYIGEDNQDRGGISGRAEYATPLRAGGRTLGVILVQAAYCIPVGTRKLADQCAVQAALAIGLDAHPLNSSAVGKTTLTDSEDAQMQERLRRVQRMEAIGTLVGGIAHDFNNLLGVILGFASLARVRLRPGDSLGESLRMIEQSVERAADLSRELLTFVRPGKSGEMRPVSIDEVLERVLKIITQTFDRRIQIHTAMESSLPAVVGDATMLEQVFLNLCLNARDSMPDGGTISIAGSVVTFGPGDAGLPASVMPGKYVCASVIDTGSGIDPQAVEHIFEPFFTTKEPEKGSGLGLAMVREIVSRHGGHVHVESEVGRGSQFTVYLPAAPQPAASPRKKKITRVARGSGEVLVVDDEPMVLAFTQRALRKLGYRVLTADNGKEACRIYAPRAGEIDCVLLDMVMPEMSGLETLQKLREINPQVRVILSSGYDPDGEVQKLIESGAVGVLNKPYGLETLARTLKENAWVRVGLSPDSGRSAPLVSERGHCRQEVS